jgi:FtsH-binding integral membrane protein
VLFYIRVAAAFWKRSLWFGISVLIFIAVAKMVWSVAFGGGSGQSVIIPAVIGLAICIVFIIIGFKKMEKRE